MKNINFESLKTAISKYYDYAKYEHNDQVTREAFKKNVKYYFESEGVNVYNTNKFTIVCDETNNDPDVHKLVCEVCFMDSELHGAMLILRIVLCDNKPLFSLSWEGDIQFFNI